MSLFHSILLTFLLFSFSGYSQVRTITEKRKNKCLTPFISSGYIHIYDPKGDIFPGPDTKDLKAGKYYPLWQPNDHCFVKGPDKRWHAFGITHPASNPGESRHQGEFLSFHTVSNAETFRKSFGDHFWVDKSKVLSPVQRPGESVANHAPVILKEHKLYKMIYGPTPFRMAISKDLYSWNPIGPIGAAKAKGRDPNLIVWKNIYYLVYCAGNSIQVTTSGDLQNWSDPVEIFRPEVETYECESPTLLHHEGKFYLFWCLWDRADKNGNGYGSRTFVYCSDHLLDFHDQPLVAELRAHAPEIFQGEDKQWYISSAQYPGRGISVARLEWK